MELYKHDYSGVCAPGEKEAWQAINTFSLGIFQWIPTSKGKEMKKSAVKVRVKGSTSYPEAVYEKAREIVRQLDAGTYSGPKYVTVKGGK